MYGMLSGGHQQHTVHHGASSLPTMFQQQQQQQQQQQSSQFFLTKSKPQCSALFNPWESNPLHHQQQQQEQQQQQQLVIDSSSSATTGILKGFEPTSVLDLRSPSPNNSRALSASSSSANNNSNKNRSSAPSAAAVSSSSSSDCNNNSDAAAVAHNLKPPKLHNPNSSSSSEQQLQDELEQAVAAAGYGFVYSSSQQESLAAGFEQQDHHHKHRGADQWLLQDVVQQDHHHHHHLLQQQNSSKQKLEELESELLSSCPSPSPAAPPETSASFMRWLLEETGAAAAAAASNNVAAVLPVSSSASSSGAAEVDVFLPPWQQQQQQQQQMMMMMVKQEQQQQQTSSLPPHLAHLESFTRRTLPLVSSAPSDQMFHPQQQQQMQFQQEHSPFGMNQLLWQQQQQQQQNLQMGFQQQQQHRDPFLLGMLQENQQQQQHLFGTQSPGLLQRTHSGFLMENLSSIAPTSSQLLHHQQHQQLRDLQTGLKQQQQRTPRAFLEDHHPNHQAALLKSQLPVPGLKRDHVQLLQGNSPGQQQFDAQQQQQHPSTKLARMSSSSQQRGGGEDLNLCSNPNSVSRQLLHAAEACESGQNELAQSILARLNDQQHHHHQVFLQQQQHQKNYVPAPAHRIGFLFRDFLIDRLSKKRKPPAAAAAASTAPADPSTIATSEEITAAELVRRVEACKSLCDNSKLLRFAHFVANQAISEAIECEDCVHILDLSEAANSSNSSFGGQWSSFIASTLQQKHKKPIKIRLTLASSRQHALFFAIESLKELARDYSNNAGGGSSSTEFEFQGVLTRPDCPFSLSDVRLQKDEVLIVNLVFGLHKLLPASEVLQTIRLSNPKLLVLVEQELEAKPSFIGRFKDGLEYYTALAESVTSESWTLEESGKVEQLVWRSEIEDLLSGNLELRKLEHWKLRMAQSGLCSFKLSEMCEKLAHSLFNFDKNNSGSSSSHNSSNRDFELRVYDGSLMLSFRGKILASASAWKCC